jgi:hypothetical protein
MRARRTIAYVERVDALHNAVCSDSAAARAAGAVTQDAAAPAPAPAGPAANTQFTLLAANASLAVAPDNTTTLTLSGLVPTAVYTQTAPVHDVGIYNASFFTAAPFYVGRAWLGQPDAVLLGGGGAVATAVVMRLQVRPPARPGG